ncbi:type II secretion system major pseudopilin GspG [Thermomonas sp.]|uniref:type II secretion system major pseudopilin GspG n=1 Tax=Thermomonas sp. TaxID=1971895 RepID=UPI00248906C3|nr:type II secretion system major pseudopilin GspG [Thermomonas sp.]MDI1254194.1 type II secretion system major pseudopilin GspG [Thermomonas sp.]
MTAIRPPRFVRIQSGFTLLEMIVVLVIIGLIMGLVGPRLFGQADKAKVQTAGTQIKMLGGALQTLRLDMGRFPTAEEGLGALVTVPTEPRAAKSWAGPYINDDVPDDPWGNPYHYAPSASGSQPYSLYSLGADAKPGGEGIDADIGRKPAQ